MSAGTDAVGSRSAAPASRRWSLSRGIARLRALAPEGSMLPEHLWRRRHRVIVASLCAHVPGLFLFGVVRGYAPEHVLLDVFPLLALAALAATTRWSPRWRMVAASTGLVTCSAMLVHLWGGVIEAHFHFFAVIGLLTRYQDWVPFLLAVGYVVLHHGVLGVLLPPSAYRNPPPPARPGPRR